MPVEGGSATAKDLVTVDSPCVNICAISDKTGMCEGCYRTIDEIAAWGRMGADERRRIMSQLPARKTSAGA